MLTELIHMTEGIAVEGRRYKAAVVTHYRVRDGLEAEKECNGKGILYISLFLLVKSIVKLGNVDKEGVFVEEVPREKVTVDSLGTMNDDDLERLQCARDFLKKKQSWQRTD